MNSVQGLISNNNKRSPARYALFQILPSKIVNFNEVVSVKNNSQNKANWQYYWNYGETTDTLNVLPARLHL